MMGWRRGAKPAGWFPRRGEVYLIDLDKERPAIVISSNSLNAHALDVCVLPISSVEHRTFSLRPKLSAGEGGLNRDSWVKCDQPATIGKHYVVYPPLGSVSVEAMARIEAAVKAALELQ